MEELEGCRRPGRAGLGTLQLNSEPSNERMARSDPVPSVVVPDESNVLVNPAHPAASEVGVSASPSFSYDLRLLDQVWSR